MNKNTLTIIAIISTFLSLPYNAMAKDLQIAIRQEVMQNVMQKNYGNTQDTRLQIEQKNSVRQRKNQSDSLASADALNKVDTVQPTSYTSNNLGAILYYALQQKNWDDAKQILAQYELTDGADPILMGYARGLLAYADGDYKQSINYLKEIIKQAPANFILPKLTLGRVEFENHQYKDAQNTFSDTKQFLDSNDPQQQGVIQTVDLFLNAIEQRKGWQGSFALGIAHNNNVNGSSGSYTCLFMFKGICLNERKTPDPISAEQFSYEGFIERRFSLSGNNGIFVKGVGFGKITKDLPEYNSHNINVSTGYSYKDSNDELSIGPSLSLSYQGGKSNNKSLGLNASWSHSFANNTVMSLNGNIEKQQFPEELKHYDGTFVGVNASVCKSFDNGWSPYARFKYAKKKADADVDSYSEKGIYLGVSKNFSGDFNLQLQTSLSKRKYDGYNAVLEAQREDVEREYNLTLSAPKWKIAGFEPSLTYTHSQNTSNIDWLYSYSQQKVELKFEKRF